MDPYDWLDRLYDALPTVACRGKCWNSCGPIDMGPSERQRIADAGVTIAPFTAERSARWAADEPLHCDALDDDKRCTVYTIRPMVCRLWGVTDTMPCEHGCTVTPSPLNDADAMDRLAVAMEMDAQLRDQMAAAMAHHTVGPLMGRYMRGERGPVEQQLAVAIMGARSELAR